MRIRLLWIGEGPADRDLLQLVAAHVGRQFDADVEHHEPASRPANTFDARRKQHSSRAVLEWVLAERPPETDRVLALTDVDLFMPVLTFVFGEAQLGGSAAVVSTARLRDQLTARAPMLLIARVLKECVHELGHTFGLVHCESPQCAMARSGNTAAVDAKRLTLCPECEGKYRIRTVPGVPGVPEVPQVLVPEVLVPEVLVPEVLVPEVPQVPASGVSKVRERDPHQPELPERLEPDGTVEPDGTAGPPRT